ncbi:MAG: trimeric intracellular cation channel family protein [Sphaerospermopsis sp. SIO1G2]|nr:trimeric intracellular cation channel family protein [Sphaerospermopsis sp. SIO1G2]
MDIFSLASIIGTIAFALSGFLVGARKELDVMGIFILAMLTANGGGAARDVVVGRLPGVLTDIYAFLIVVGVIAGALLFRLHTHTQLEKHRLFVLSDSLGLVAFSITGALVGIEEGLSIFGVMVLAFFTASGGGVLRDVMVNQIPSVLSSDFYGSVAILLAASLYGLHAYGLDNDVSIAILFIAALALRLVAYRCQWRLPRIRMK